jgi:RNA polymerase sigma-B factor
VVAQGDERGVTRTPGELAEELQLDVCDVLEALQAREAFAATSLSAAAFSAADEAPSSLGDTLGSPEDGYERVELRVMLDGGLRALRAREREILRMRFVEDRTQSDIAATVGVSQMHVSRLLRESFERLRLSLEHAA